MKRTFSIIALAFFLQVTAQSDRFNLNIDVNVHSSKTTGDTVAVAVPVNGNITIEGYGNSIMYGQGASVPDSTFFEQVVKYVGGRGINYAVPGQKDYDQLIALHKTPGNAGKTLKLWETGTNNLRRAQANDPNSRVVELSNWAIKTFLVECFKETEVSTHNISVAGFAPGSNIPGTGDWRPSASLLRFTRFVPNNATAMGTKYEYYFTGKSCYVNMLLHGNNWDILFSTYKIYIDGILVETGNNFFQGSDAGYAHNLSHVFTNLSYGFHTLTVEHSGDYGTDNGRSLSVEKFGTLRVPQLCNPAIVSAIAPMNIAQHGGGLTQAGLDGINQKRGELVSSFAMLGYPVYYNSLSGVTADDTIDGLHFTDAGNRKIFNTYKPILDSIYNH